MEILYQDQIIMHQQTALQNGVPEVRYVVSPRTGTGAERVDAFFDQVIPALMAPLTEQEQWEGTYIPPENPRIAFEGTMEEAHQFYQREEFFMCHIPMTLWTDGAPIILPTEEKVQEMLKHTSHPPDEVIYRVGSDRPVLFQPMGWTATVERVAVNAVMAGCKPEFFPVVLAMATSGCSTGTTTFWCQWQMVSGPIVKEIGMNYSVGPLDPGNIANATIGRAYQLMAINLGGAQVGVNRMNSIGSPFNTGSTTFAENPDGLPEGWMGFNEEMGYSKDESVILVGRTARGIIGDQFAPSSYRGLQSKGVGGMAERLGVEGIPGPHNWIEYLIPGVWANTVGPITFLMVPSMAKDLKNYGFGSKEAVYEWLWNASMMPMHQYRQYGWYDFTTSGGTRIEPISGKPYKDLPDDAMTPAAGRRPMDNIIIVTGGAEEVSLQMLNGSSVRNSTYPIDPWR